MDNSFAGLVHVCAYPSRATQAERGGPGLVCPRDEKSCDDVRAHAWPGVGVGVRCISVAPVTPQTLWTPIIIASRSVWTVRAGVRYRAQHEFILDPAATFCDRIQFVVNKQARAASDWRDQYAVYTTAPIKPRLLESQPQRTWSSI